MDKDATDGSVVEVTLKSRPEYLSRVRRIAACLADSAEMDGRESEEAALALTEACANAIRHGSPRGEGDLVSITLSASRRSLVAEITDSGSYPESGMDEAGMGVRLMRSLADDVRFVRRESGMTVRITKRARRRRVRVRLTE